MIDEEKIKVGHSLWCLYNNRPLKIIVHDILFRLFDWGVQVDVVGYGENAVNIPIEWCYFTGMELIKDQNNYWCDMRLMKIVKDNP